MLLVCDADWSRLVPPGENPLDFLLRKDVPVYIKVRRDSQIVYRYYMLPLAKNVVESRAPAAAFLNPSALFLEGEALDEFGKSKASECESVDAFPVSGYLEDVVFLRLDDSALAEIVVSRSCHVSRFTGGGFLMPRPYEITAHSRGGHTTRKPLRIQSAELAKFECDRAFIVNKKDRDRMLASVPAINAPSPEQLASQIEVGEKDLYVTSADFEALMQDARKNFEVVDYPFDHGKQMPGIYWMFQAAAALNEKRMIGEDEVLGWLRAECPGDTFAGKRGNFAAKLVPKELDRAKGRKGGPRPFNIWDLKNWTGDQHFIFDFVSDGLTVMLAVADWWLELLERSPNEPRITLAKKLYEQNFDQTETGHIVRLIAGVQLSKDEGKVFTEWVQREGRSRSPQAG